MNSFLVRETDSREQKWVSRSPSSSNQIYSSLSLRANCAHLSVSLTSKISTFFPLLLSNHKLRPLEVTCRRRGKQQQQQQQLGSTGQQNKAARWEEGMQGDCGSHECWGERRERMWALLSCDFLLFCFVLFCLFSKKKKLYPLPWGNVSQNASGVNQMKVPPPPPIPIYSRKISH